MLRKNTLLPYFQALLAAVLFGAAAPLAKLLLGDVDPIPMASFLYLGSGLAALFLLGITNLSRKGQSIEAHLTRSDMPWMAGAMFVGGVAAPIVLLLSLQNTPASTASLLPHQSTVRIKFVFILESIRVDHLR